MTSPVFSKTALYIDFLSQWSLARLSSHFGTLIKGRKKLYIQTILLKSTMRNMYGPHHCRGMQEDWPIARHNFTFLKEWQSGKPDYFIEEYNLSTFGIEKIQIEVK